MAAAKARSNGEGSVYQRKDGRWVGEIEVGRLATGKPDRRYVYRKTEREARRALAEIVRQNDKGSLITKEKVRETVAGFIEYWLETHHVRPSTHKRYCELLRLHVVPEIGKHKLTSLKVEHVKLMVAHLRIKVPEHGLGRKPGNTKPLSPQTIRHIFVALHTVLEQAVREEYVGRNVCDSMRDSVPSVKRAETYPPSLEELHRLLSTANEAGDRFHILWLVAAYSGARLGELLALQWGDIDFSARTVAIRRTLLQTTRCGIPVYGDPKTERSRRTITLPQRVMDALKEHRRQQLEQRLSVGEGYTANDLVFATHTGTPLSHRNMARAFKAALKLAGLPEVFRIHDLRHAHATNLRRAGVEIKDVSDRLGHSTIAITADLYTHAVPGLDAAAADKFDAALGF